MCAAVMVYYLLMASGQSKIEGVENSTSFPFPFLLHPLSSLPLFFSSPSLLLPSLTLEVGPLNIARGSEGALYTSPAGSGAESPAEIEIGYV